MSCLDSGDQHEFRHVGRGRYSCKWCDYIYEDEGYGDFLYEQEKDRRLGL